MPNFLKSFTYRNAGTKGIHLIWDLYFSFKMCGKVDRIMNKSNKQA
jgi:hypothetical protein